MSTEAGRAEKPASAEDKPTPEMAVLLTFLFGPGMGHFYAGEIGRGAMFVATLVLSGPLLVWLAATTRLVTVLGALGAFVALTIIAWIASAFDVGRGRARFAPSAPPLRGLRVVGAGLGAPALVVLASALLRAFVLEAFKVPSSSMVPTLLLGDHFFADKRSRAWAPGEVLVFTLPAQPNADFVKRVIARGRDVVSVDTAGLPTVNEVPAKRCPLGRAPASAGGPPFDYFLETLAGRSYLVVLDPAVEASPAFARFEVPEGAVFVLGDNRHNSFDSRMWNEGRGGAVPLQMVKGIAFGTWWSPATDTFTARDRALDVPMLPPFAASLQAALAACSK